ncbi:MAG: hypothetical protein ACKO2G_16355 [Verrucomicrobiales bacterium]
MKPELHSYRKGAGGYITFLIVMSVAVVAFAFLLAAYKATLRAQETQKTTQLRVDVAQRESAILRSILAVVPNKAIQCMQENSSLSPTPYNWTTISTESIALANAADADADGVGANIGSARLANPANFTGSVSNIFRGASGSGLINAGVNTQLSADYPPYLTTSLTTASLDATYPIVAETKTYGTNAAGTAQLSTSLYPIYNRIPYPKIRFGYSQSNASFVAKRNYWAFSIRYPESVPGVSRTRKLYVLSLYEVPSQVAISASVFMSLGRYSTGEKWAGVQINGAVFGERILAEESLSLNRLSSRAGIQIESGAAQSVAGTTAQNGFDSGNTIQSFEAANDAMFPVSVAGGFGRIAFVPLNRGLDFYRFLNTTGDSNRLSPTSWNDYTIGARRCAIKVTVTQCTSASNQTPTTIVVSYLTSSGTGSFTLTRGSHWPTDSQSGGTAIPFQTETIQTGRRCLSVHVDRLAGWLTARGALGVDSNNYIAINPDTSQSTVRTPTFPSNSLDMGITLRGGGGLTAFTKGFSLVTNLRLFFAADLNNIPTTAPAGSGLSGTFYPPLSIFAPEKRWGTTTTPRLVRFRGQLGALDSGSGEMIRPLDLRTGGTDEVAEDMDAILNEITSPAQLPPITFPNWLLTIEEVDTNSAGNT